MCSSVDLYFPLISPLKRQPVESRRLASLRQFYKTWVNTPLKAQEQVEAITRSHIGVPCCPVAGIPLPDERELLMQTQELDLK